MGFAKSGGDRVWSRRQWQRKMEEERARDVCGHVWQWDPQDRIMRCYKCGGARIATETDRFTPRMEGTDTDF